MIVRRQKYATIAKAPINIDTQIRQNWQLVKDYLYPINRTSDER